MASNVRARSPAFPASEIRKSKRAKLVKPVEKIVDPDDDESDVDYVETAHDNSSDDENSSEEVQNCSDDELADPKPSRHSQKASITRDIAMRRKSDASRVVARQQHDMEKKLLDNWMLLQQHKEAKQPTQTNLVGNEFLNKLIARQCGMQGKSQKLVTKFKNAVERAQRRNYWHAMYPDIEKEMGWTPDETLNIGAVARVQAELDVGRKKSENDQEESQVDQRKDDVLQAKYDALRKKYVDAQEELDDSKGENETLKGKLADSMGENETMKEKLVALQEKCDSVHEGVDVFQEKFEDAQDKLQASQATVDSLSGTIHDERKSHTAELKEHREAYSFLQAKNKDVQAENKSLQAENKDLKTRLVNATTQSSSRLGSRHSPEQPQDAETLQEIESTVDLVQIDVTRIPVAEDDRNCGTQTEYTDQLELIRLSRLIYEDGLAKVAGKLVHKRPASLTRSRR